MAEFFASHVWNDLHINTTRKPPIFETSDKVDLDPFSMQELDEVLHMLKNIKAPGPDGIPSEFWKWLS